MSSKILACAVVLLACLSLAAGQECKTFAALGAWCQDSQGACCGGAPKNAKCVNYVCTSTAPGAQTPAPPPPATSCQKYSALGSWCEDRSGNCCAGGPKNAKCENYVCISTAPSPGQTPAPAPAPAPSGGGCAKFSNIGEKCDEKAGVCCGGGPKNTSCKNAVCVSNYPSGRRML